MALSAHVQHAMPAIPPLLLWHGSRKLADNATWDQTIHKLKSITNLSTACFITHKKADMNLKAPPKILTTADMSVPTCVTCHLSGLDGLNVTHDTTERLSYWLFAAVSDKRPTYQQGQDAMKETCLKCHARSQVEKFYQEAEGVVADTNEKIREAGRR